jgi:hypothetical protein
VIKVSSGLTPRRQVDNYYLEISLEKTFDLTAESQRAQRIIFFMFVVERTTNIKVNQLGMAESPLA